MDSLSQGKHPTTTSHYEGYVFRFSGVTTGAGTTIAASTVLDKVILTTRDLLSGTTEAAELNDALGLSGGEAATFQISGNVIANTSPIFGAVFFNTNAGAISALVFTMASVTYALATPGTIFDAATRITAPSLVIRQSVPVVNPISYGLLPEAANTYCAHVFSTQDFGGPERGLPDASAIGTVTLYDTDLVGGNGALQRTVYQETLTTVQFGGSFILGGVETLRNSGYSGYVTAFNYLFDVAKLAASGHTLAAVRGVLSSVAFDHDLIWLEAGLVLAAGPPPDGGNNGTARANVLNGTTAADAIRGFDGNDTLTGNGGNNVFIFGQILAAAVGW